LEIKAYQKETSDRIAKPLNKFGAKIKLTKKGIPLTIKGNEILSPIRYIEQKGSATV
jgi:5-enolpyruvylshikimate-3-phosphate synthase